MNLNDDDQIVVDPNFSLTNDRLLTSDNRVDRDEQKDLDYPNTSEWTPLIDDDDDDDDDDGNDIRDGSKIKHFQRKMFHRGHIRKNLIVSFPKLTGCKVM